METTAVDTGLTFGEPLWFWALLLVPLLAGLFVWAQRKRDALIRWVVAPRLRAQLASGVNSVLRTLRVVLLLLAITLCIVALAKPRMGYIQREIKTTGRDVLLAIDTSRSMLATDITPTRLARAKLVSQDLMRLLQGDRIGLIAFAGSAFLQAPLTLDYTAVLNTLDELDTDVIPRGGTNLAAAIQTAIDGFGKAEGVLRALVILTDGEELDADGIAAAKRAAENGVRIFTIGIGSAEGSLIPIQTEDGRQDYVRDSQNKPVSSRLDAKRLSEIAEVTGGFYAPISPDVAREIFDRGIEPMERTDTGSMSSRRPLEQYLWPLGGAIFCLMLWILIGEGRGRPWKVRRAATAAGVGLFVLSAGRLEAAPGALESYNQGDYQAALEQFERSVGTVPETEKLQFNAGASAYKLGEYGKAVDHFTSALLTEETALRTDASYNLANALVRRGEAAKSGEAKVKDWEDAIEHYTTALNLDPSNSRAEENREIVRKLLEDLKKEQEEQKQEQQQKQDQQDQQKQDQQDQQQKQDNPQKQEQEQQEGQQDQPQQPQDQGEQEEREGQDQQEQEGQNEPNEGDPQEGESGEEQQEQSGESQADAQNEGQPEDSPNGQPQDQQAGNQQQPAPAPTPGEKKEGDLQANPDQNADGSEQAEAGEAGEEEREGEMSEAQARGLLRSMEGEEENVRMLERRSIQDVTKDW